MHWKLKAALGFAVVLLFAAPAIAQQVDVPPDGGGAMIIIDGERMFIEGNVRGTDNDDLLPTPQQLRAITITPEVRSLVGELDSPDFAEREKATRKLIDLRIENVQFYAMLERDELSAEQRSRLLAVIRERVVNAPRGALGIHMDVAGRPGVDGEVREGVAVLDLIAGMPAERVLRVNDRITHIGDSRIFSAEDLIMLVQGRRPGDSVGLTVERVVRDDTNAIVRDENGKATFENLELTIKLGSVEQLHDTRGPAAPSRVELDRRREAAAALQRYGQFGRPLNLRLP